MEIRIYVEGGGDNKDTKAKVRQGFSEFFKEVDDRAKEKGIKFLVIFCGNDDSTFRNFQRALRSNPNAFNLLLVDSDSPVNTEPRQHLQTFHNWNLSAIAAEQCHLMAQVFEAWLIADIDTLKSFYGQGFNSNPIPGNPDVERIDKDGLYSSLKQATRNTKKGEYHKIRHGPEILKRADASKVREAAAHCNRLFETLEEKIGT